MDDFPWGALIAAASGFLIAGVQVAISLYSLDARISKTSKLLESVTSSAPGSDATRALKDTLDILAARKAAKAVKGGAGFFSTLALVEAFLVLQMLISNTNVGTLTFWIALAGTVGAAIASGLAYWRYLGAVSDYHSVGTKQPPIAPFEQPVTGN